MTASDAGPGPAPSWVGEHRREPWRDLDRWDRASIAVDCVLLTVIDRQLQVLVQKRRADPQVGKWALPGAFVTFPSTEDDVVGWAVKEKAGLDLGEFYREHLDWSSNPSRDPRGWVVAHAFLGLAPGAVVREAVNAGPIGPDVALAPVLVPAIGEHVDGVVVHHPGGRARLAFDHEQLVALAVRRLRGKIRYTDLALSLVGDEFPLRDLQDACEAVLGYPLSRATFQKLVIDDLQLVEPTGEKEPLGVGRRRAQLYRPKQ